MNKLWNLSIYIRPCAMLPESNGLLSWKGTSLLPLLKSPEATKVWGFPLDMDFTFIQDQYFYTEWRDKDERIIERMLFDHSNDGDENYNVAGKEENKAIT